MANFNDKYARINVDKDSKIYKEFSQDFDKDLDNDINGDIIKFVINDK